MPALKNDLLFILSNSYQDYKKTTVPETVHWKSESLKYDTSRSMKKIQPLPFEGYPD